MDAPFRSLSQRVLRRVIMKFHYFYFFVWIGAAFFSVASPETVTTCSGAESKQKDCSGCWWGKAGEKTTYSPPYCPAMAPEIPLVPSREEREKSAKKYPMSPEDAVCVVMADGCRYCYYYREAVRYRTVSEFKWVFEPMEKMETCPIDEINPLTGNVETRWVTEPVKTTFPVYHEKEFVRYEPEKVLVRVIIPGDKTDRTDAGVQGNGSAAIRFSTEVKL